MSLPSLRQVSIILILIVFFNSQQVSAQTYNDGPIELQIRVSAVRVDYDTFSNLSNDFYLTSSMTSIIGNIMPVPGLQVDEITCKVWVRDNMGSNWQGGSCILADLLMSGGGPDIYMLPAPEIIFTQTYAGQQVPQFVDLKLEAWEDDISADFDQLPASIPFVITNTCQVSNGYSRCAYETSSSGCFNLFGAGVMAEADDIYCDANPFKINLDYRAAGPPGQWNSHGFIAGNCPTNNFYQPQIESFWRYINVTSDSISGRVISEIGSPVSSATLKAVGTGNVHTTSTAANGNYTLALDSGYSYMVTPAKSNDLTVSNGISSVDFLLIRRHILGTPLSSPYKIIAADVNNSGSVSTADVLLVRSMILQMITAFPGNKLWAFVPHHFVFADPTNPFPYDTSRSYLSVSQMSGQDFIGMKLGDVNNSWDPNILKNESYSGEVDLTIDDAEATHVGEEITIPVRAGLFENVSGMQFTLSWDKELFTFLGVENQKLQADYATQKTSEGMLGVLWTDENAEGKTLGDEILFSVKLIANKVGKCDLNINAAMIPVEAVNGNLELLRIVNVKKEEEASYNGYELRSFPNPFKDAIIVQFKLPVEENVRLQIFNLVGKQVREYSGNYDAGNHQLTMERKDLPSGTYFLKLRAGGFEQNLKIVGL